MGRAIAVFDIDGVIRDVGNSYRRALADTVEHFTLGAYRPSPQDIDGLKGEGIWNNDWEGSQELIYRYFEAQGQERGAIALDYDQVVDYFQRRYRGSQLDDPDQWDGYITQEPLLVGAEYFQGLQMGGIPYGFFSGATRGSAQYVLERRLGLAQPPLVAMEDAPGKPDPTGLFQVLDVLTPAWEEQAIFYAGDTVADMHTLQAARQQRPEVTWIGVGILPPHVAQGEDAYREAYGVALQGAGAALVLPQVLALTPATCDRLLAEPSALG